MRLSRARSLCGLVEGYVDFDMAGWRPGRHRGLPDASLTLVVSLGSPLTLRYAGRAVVSRATIAGLRSGPVDVVHDAAARGVQIALTPHGSRALLGLPASELVEGVWPLEQVIGGRAEVLADRLAEARDAAARAAVLDAVLAEWSVAATYPGTVDAVWRAITDSGGRAAVSSIADEMGFSRRHLGQLVRAELGLAPKVLARITRFARARSCLQRGRTRGLAETAAVCGYFDQAHLSYDWKRLAGCTPGQWLCEELPFLQDGARLDGAC